MKKVPRHHQHKAHIKGFIHHDHDDLGYHIHHRGPDYVTYFAGSSSSTYTGTPEMELDNE